MKKKLVSNIIIISAFCLLTLLCGFILLENRNLKSKLNKEILIKEKIESEKLQLQKKDSFQNKKQIITTDIDSTNNQD
jgi:hypothetical protein